MRNIISFEKLVDFNLLFLQQCWFIKDPIVSRPKKPFPKSPRIENLSLTSGARLKDIYLPLRK